ncbi:MAG: Na/Pi cotransporter family protein [Firmicutes bacterium]|nr:Na/Pi cotransporter family protein [Bacillota bacterium]
MSIFDIISLFGGLALFLYGMRLMGDSLKENSSGALKTVMEKVTDSSLKAFLLGIAVTALIQSSTATIVITSGLVAAGILSLHQSLGIIIGANVGTTVTGQIIRLLDLNESGFLRFFQPSTLAPIALVIGIILIMTHTRAAGNILIGFGILFSGLLNMTSAVKALQQSGLIEGLMMGLGDNPFVGYLTGAGVAFALQSSSATIGILQAFSATGLLSFKAIYSVIVGIYLGDCVTTAIVCSIGANREARRVGIVNILFNLSETVLVLTVVTLLHKLGLLDALWDKTVNSGMIANTNTIFNLACAITLLPAVGIYEKLSGKIVKEAKKPEGKYDKVIEGLSTVFFSSPALALRSCYDTLVTMLNISRENLKKAQAQLNHYQLDAHEEILSEELQVDRLTDNLSRYMVELFPHLQSEAHVAILNQYYRISVEFERLGDHAVNISDIAKKLAEGDTVFSEACMKELAVLVLLLENILDDCEQSFKYKNPEVASLIEPKVRVVTELVSKLVNNHFNRMSAGECSLLADSAFTNLMGEYKRIGAICSNVGIATMVRTRPELAAQEHLFFETLDQKGDSQYNKVFEETHKQYFDLLAG